ncbi:hypothetical protein [Akkermansia glycaniphila]|uniref:Uncharacterized protein n=1 Tax=Akkermansia glycaniphila TaxID=1679444 RepID=A0A1H6M854_9BACT|nr:hypothetical protein [Akkermansia glycaniphila]SEH97557.1 Hypothetical protein PYTT_2224 [Akkermansia glycaniphila]
MFQAFFLSVSCFFAFWTSTAVFAEPLASEDIVPESREDVIAQHLRRADTVLLVCVYTSSYEPVRAGNGVVWKRVYHSRVVQGLRGNLPVGAVLEIEQIAESLPESGVIHSDGSKRFISSPVQGELWYVFLDSKGIDKKAGDVYSCPLDVMFLNPLKMKDKDGIQSFNRLVHVQDARIAEEAEAARFRKEE